MPSRQNKYGQCPLCLRATTLTFHHLIPRKVHRRARFKKHFTRNELNKGIDICRPCHNGIHKSYDEMTLAKSLNSLEALHQDEPLARHFRWVAKRRTQ